MSTPPLSLEEAPPSEGGAPRAEPPLLPAALVDRVPARLRPWLPALAITITLGLFFGGAFALRLRLLKNPLALAGDARQQIYPFLRYYDAGTFPADYLGDYFLSAMPIGYRALFTAFSTFINPITLSKIVPFLLLAPLLGGIAVAAKRLSGWLGAFFALALALSCPLYLERMAGGLPRAFGYPLMALTAAALVTGRVRALAGLVLAGAAFYPTAAVPAGIALAVLLFVYPAAERGEASAWSVKRRFVLVASTAILAALIVLPSALTAKRYGRGLAPADAIEYPEIGPDGRYGPNDRAPFGPFSTHAITQARRALKGDGVPFVKGINAWVKAKPAAFGLTREDAALEFLLAAITVGTVFLARRRAEARRLLALAIAAWAAYFIGCAVAPYFYMPLRYISYPVPLLVMILLPAAGAALALELRDLAGVADSRALARPIGVLALSAFCLVALGGRGNAYAGLSDESRHAPLYAYLATLPKDALIAGFPDETMDNVPYAARRQALVTYECHQAFNQGHADEMRRRTRALVAAYFAGDVAPLLKLRDTFGVTHLLVDRRHFDKVPTYFKPFDEDIRRAAEAGRTPGFELLRQIEPAAIHTSGDFAVLDLRRLRTEAK